MLRMWCPQTRRLTKNVELHTNHIPATFLVYVSYPPPLVGIIGICWLVCALWPKPAMQAGALALSDLYLLEERARVRRSKAKEGGVIVIIFFSFFFGCVRVDVRILTARAQAKAPAPPTRKGDIILPFPVLTAALPQDSILFECRFFSLWASAGSEMINTVVASMKLLVFLTPDPPFY